MLANSLQELMDDGLVSRIQYNEMPLRVEYSLTETGKSLFPILSEITSWGAEQQNRNMQNSRAQKEDL